MDDVSLAACILHVEQAVQLQQVSLAAGSGARFMGSELKPLSMSRCDCLALGACLSLSL